MSLAIVEPAVERPLDAVSTSDLLRMRLALFEEIADQQAELEAIDKTILARTSARFNKAREIVGRPYGVVGTEIDGFEVIASFSREVTWHQDRLAEIAPKFPVLAKVTYSVDEALLRKAGEETRKLFEDARTVKYGSQIVSVTEKRKGG